MRKTAGSAQKLRIVKVAESDLCSGVLGAGLLVVTWSCGALVTLVGDICHFRALLVLSLIERTT